MRPTARKAVAFWLSSCLLLVCLMVLVGGLTRLTESGLSIVEWKPIAGIFPPSTDEEWLAELEAYKTSPQAEKVFPDITVEEFQRIYWLEYIHRLLGRAVGIVFLLPLIAFAALRWVTPKQFLNFSAIFALGGIQGLIGWYMVKSGLVDDPRVSPYRLALHMGVAMLLFGCLLWQLLSLLRPTHPDEGGFQLPPPGEGIKWFACGVTLLIFLQIIAGAFVAGLDAGLAYNTFPTMDGEWIPEGLWPQPDAPWYVNLLENMTAVQFIHRILAYLLATIIPLLWFAGRNNPHIAHLLPILFSIFVVQFLLGVLTLLFTVPIPLASLHQGNALLLLGMAVTILHRLFLPLKAIRYDLGSPMAAS